jgi:WD40 repeat protein
MEVLEGHSDEVLRACWPEQSAIELATGGADGLVKLWARTRRRKRSSSSSSSSSDEQGFDLECMADLDHSDGPGRDGQVYALHSLGVAGSVSLLTASDDRCTLWDAVTCKQKQQWSFAAVGEHQIGGGRNPDDLAFVFDLKPEPLDGTLAAAALSDGTIRLQCISGSSSSSSSAAQVLRSGTSKHLTGVSWSPDGMFLSVCSGSGHVELWDKRMWRALACFQAHDRPAYGTSFVGDSLLISWSSDHSVRGWDLTSGLQLLWTLETEHYPVYHCTLDPAGSKLAVAGGGGSCGGHTHSHSDRDAFEAYIVPLREPIQESQFQEHLSFEAER